MKFLFKLVFHIAATAGVLWLFDKYIFEGYFNISGEQVWVSYVVVAFVFGFLNLFVKPVLKVLALPVQFFTLGLAGLVLNGIILWATQEVVHFSGVNQTQVEIDGVLIYIIVGLGLGLANTIVHWID